MAKFVTLIIFIVVVQGVGGLIGTSFMPGEWYDGLAKPFFNPPPVAFGVAWPLLYLLIAIAGWRVFSSEGETPGWGLWVSQMLMNWAWTPLFFGAQQIFWGLVLIFATLAVALTFIATVWDRDRLAGLCFIPYAAWLTFAMILNFSVWVLN